MELIKQNTTQISLRKMSESDFVKKSFEFGELLQRILNLSGEKSMENLEAILILLKDLAQGLTFQELQKAFSMYAKGKMSIEPRSNYLDVIHFSKIVNEYQKTFKRNNTNKPLLKIEKMDPEETELIMIEVEDRIKKEYNQNGSITSICNHLYDWLFENKKLPEEKEYKIKIYKEAKIIAKKELENEARGDYDKHRQLEKAIKNLEVNGKNGRVIKISKRLVLEEYFEKLKNKDSKAN